jgi:hypothetical protein
MPRLTTVAIGTLAALAVAVPATAAPSAASAQAGRSWTTVTSLGGAKQQACKVSVAGGAAWRIYNRLDARNAGSRVRASMTVTRGGATTSRVWNSGWVHKGDISSTGTVRLARAAGYGLQFTLAADQMGNGGLVKARSIRLC